MTIKQQRGQEYDRIFRKLKDVFLRQGLPEDEAIVEAHHLAMKEMLATVKL